MQDEETKEEETGVKLNKDLTDEEFDIILDELRGETMSNRWEEVDAREYKDDNESEEEWASRLIQSCLLYTSPSPRDRG